MRAKGREFRRIGEEVVDKVGATLWVEVTRGSPNQWRVARRNPMGTVPIITYTEHGTARSYRAAVEAGNAALKERLA